MEHLTLCFPNPLHIECWEVKHLFFRRYPMKKNSLILLAILGMSSFAFADVQSSNLHAERLKVVQEYIDDLGAANVQNITSLFTNDAMVISTSRGTANAIEFFSNFLPQVSSAETQQHQVFISTQDVNHYAARFHLKYQLKDGDIGNGEYMDDFIFEENSPRLAAVYMFENLKFPQPK